MQTLILIEAPDDDWSVKAFRDNGFNVGIIFKRINKGLRAIRREWILKGLPHKDIWYGDWKYSIREFDQIIIFVNSLCLELPLYLNKVVPGKRVIAWYWNCVDDSINPRKIKGKCEKWSFDPENCKKYNMKFNHQFYFKSLVKKKNIIDYDVYFCGTDSGRGQEIVAIYNEMRKMGLRTKFQVVNPKYNEIPKEIISSPQSYESITENIAKTKAILEVVRKGQSGATIRTMEALFNGKKLITTNRNIRNESFYNNENVFILGVDHGEELCNFMLFGNNCDTEQIVDDYDVRTWFNNFNRS